MTFGSISPAHPVIAPSALELKLKQAQTDAQAAVAHTPLPANGPPVPTAKSSALLDTVA